MNKKSRIHCKTSYFCHAEFISASHKILKRVQDDGFATVSKPNYRIYIFLLALFLISLPFRLYHISYPLLDSFNFRQTQTATFALNFYKYGINFFNTELDMFGVGPEKYLLLEFPLYEAAVALLYKIFAPDIVWGRLVSIISGFVGAFFLFKITGTLTGSVKTAFFAAAFFLFLPLNLFYHRAFMIDPAVIAFLLAGLHFGLKYINAFRSKYLFSAIVLLSLGLIQKVLYGPFWLIPLALYWLRKKRSVNLGVILLFLMPLLVLFFWQLFENRQNILHGHPFFTSESVEHLLWNIGTISDRFKPSLWQFRLQQILNGTMLKPGLILFIIGLFTVRFYRDSLILYGFLLSQILYFVILFRIQTQNYYQLVLIPVVSIFMAVGLTGISKAIKLRLLSAFLISLFFVFYISKSWQNTLPSFYIDWNWFHTLSEIGRILPGDSHGVFATAGYDWNSSYSYYINKKLLSVSVEDVTEKKLNLWRQDGYSFLILYDENKILTRLRELGMPDRLNWLNKFPLIYNRNNIRIHRI